MIRDSAGNFYGTASGGGITKGCREAKFGCGVVYSMTATGEETVLYTFTGGADGSAPLAGLIRDSAGNFYGTTGYGGQQSGQCGSSGCGVVFKVQSLGTETVLHTFAFSDGENPHAALVRDAAGNLYGTTEYGGHAGTSCFYGDLGCGTVFKLKAVGSETVLHTFSGQSDGASPFAALVPYQGSWYARPRSAALRPLASCLRSCRNGARFGRLARTLSGREARSLN